MYIWLLNFVCSCYCSELIKLKLLLVDGGMDGLIYGKKNSDKGSLQKYETKGFLKRRNEQRERIKNKLFVETEVLLYKLFHSVLDQIISR